MRGVHWLPLEGGRQHKRNKNITRKYVYPGMVTESGRSLLQLLVAVCVVCLLFLALSVPPAGSWSFGGCGRRRYVLLRRSPYRPLYTALVIQKGFPIPSGPFRLPFGLRLNRMSEAKGETKPLWRTATDPKSGREYYYNSVTKETTWTKPDALLTVCIAGVGP